MSVCLRKGCFFEMRRFFLNALSGGDSNISGTDVAVDSVRAAEKPLLVGPSACEVAEVDVGLVLWESGDSWLLEDRASLAVDGTFLMSWSSAENWNTVNKRVRGS